MQKIRKKFNASTCCQTLKTHSEPILAQKLQNKVFSHYTTVTFCQKPERSHTLIFDHFELTSSLSRPKTIKYDLYQKVILMLILKLYLTVSLSEKSELFSKKCSSVTF